MFLEDDLFDKALSEDESDKSNLFYFTFSGDFSFLGDFSFSDDFFFIGELTYGILGFVKF